MNDKKYVFEIVVRETENLEKICSTITACDYTFEELKERKVDNEILICKDILVDHLPKKELEKYFKDSQAPFIGAPQKVVNSDYVVDTNNNEFISKKKQSEEELQKVILKSDDKDDPKMTDEDWNDLANQLYSNKNTYECYPENYLQTDCMYFLEICNNTDWKLCLRNNLSVPKFDLSGELHPYTLGEGKIEKPEMNSMYNLRNLKRIVDGLNLLVKPNENLKPYPKMSKGDWKKFREDDPR